MDKRSEGEGDQKGGELKRRLKGVRKRKQAQRRLERDASAFKMRLVKTRRPIER